MKEINLDELSKSLRRKTKSFQFDSPLFEQAKLLTPRVFVMGAEGTGKTSLVKYGYLPYLLKTNNNLLYVGEGNQTEEKELKAIAAKFDPDIDIINLLEQSEGMMENNEIGRKLFYILLEPGSSIEEEEIEGILKRVEGFLPYAIIDETPFADLELKKHSFRFSRFQSFVMVVKGRRKEIPENGFPNIISSVSKDLYYSFMNHDNRMVIKLGDFWNKPNFLQKLFSA